MDTKQAEIEIPKVEYKGEDEKLLERVTKFKAGTIRIIVFTIVGMIMGWFSYYYVRDTFIVTKIVLAVPYKLSEAIYTSIIGTGSNINMNDMFTTYTEFFHQSMLATFLAERITPILLGGAIYGALAYFTGDKKVFTMQRFVKFISIWFVIIVLYIGSVYAVNAKAIDDNNSMRNISYFFLISPNQGKAILDKRDKTAMMDAFEDGLREDSSIKRDRNNEFKMGIVYANGRQMTSNVNWKVGYLVTENGTIYHISDVFAGYVKNYYDTGRLMGFENIITE